MAYRQHRKQNKLPNLPLKYKVRKIHYDPNHGGVWTSKPQDKWEDVDAHSPEEAAEKFMEQRSDVANVQVKRSETSFFY